MNSLQILALIGAVIGVTSFSLMINTAGHIDASAYVTPVVGLVASVIGVVATLYFDRDLSLVALIAVVAAINILAGGLLGIVSGGIFIAAAVKARPIAKKAEPSAEPKQEPEGKPEPPVAQQPEPEQKNMQVCSVCGTELVDGSCPKCGSDLSPAQAKN